jgi:hypothetical protein
MARGISMREIVQIELRGWGDLTLFSDLLCHAPIPLSPDCCFEVLVHFFGGSITQPLHLCNLVREGTRSLFSMPIVIQVNFHSIAGYQHSRREWKTLIQILRVFHLVGAAGKTEWKGWWNGQDLEIHRSLYSPRIPSDTLKLSLIGQGFRCILVFCCVSFWSRPLQERLPGILWRGAVPVLDIQLCEGLDIGVHWQYSATEASSTSCDVHSGDEASPP